MKWPIISIISIIFSLFISRTYLNSQCIIVGADLSYVNTIIENDGNYLDELGNTIEPFGFFAEKGADMIRLRLWHTPENITDYCGHPVKANNLEDLLLAADKVVDAGMEIMLALHYGDYFNDPGKQKMPAAWLGSSHSDLLDSIYNYTFKVLEKLNDQESLPSIIGIGNETTWGFIDATASTNGWSWPQDAEKFNSAFEAVNDFNAQNGTSIKKAVHFTTSTATWLAGLFETKGITDFDIIGLSYYPEWSPETDLDDLGAMIEELNADYQKEIMVFETGFVWKVNGWVDNYNNILNGNGNVLAQSATPEGQRDYLLELCQSVYEHNGSGVFYWEPAYISSDMCTIWGQGSPYENVTFFDFTQNNTALPGFDFFNFCESINNTNTSKKTIKIIPNPSHSGYFEINGINGYKDWSVFSTDGRLIVNGKLGLSEDRLMLNLSNQESGIYTIVFLSTSGKSTSVNRLFLIY